MIMRIPDVGSQYLMGFLDADKNYFDGAKTYKVTLPKDIPARAFWSFTLYDNQTRSMLDTPQRYPRAGSQSYPSPAAEADADGSTTVYFGPSSPRASSAATGSRPCPARAGSRSCASTAGVLDRGGGWAGGGGRGVGEGGGCSGLFRAMPFAMLLAGCDRAGANRLSPQRWGGGGAGRRGRGGCAGGAITTGAGTGAGEPTRRPAATGCRAN